MKRAIAWSMLVCLLFCISPAAGCAPKDDKALRLTVTGYLVCQKCGAASHCLGDGIDLSNHPEDHRLACLLEPDCIVSGYGLMLDQDEATWSGIHNDAGSYIFYPFDYAGSRLALDEVDQSKKTNDLLVEVTVVIDPRGGEMRLVEIKEK